MGNVDDITDRLSKRGIAALGVIAVVVPLAGTVVAQGIVDGILVAVAAAAGGGAGWLWNQRRQLERLPLELSRVAVRGEIDGVPVVKVRARLGRGRVARDPEVRMAFRGADGREVILPVVFVAPVVCGAFTITAFDRTRVTLAPGALDVRVRVRAGARSWEAERTFASIEDGTFAAPVVRRAGRLAHDRERWESLR